MWGGSGGGRCVQFNWGGSGANVDWGECVLGRCAIVGRIPYWGCKSNLCGADLEGGGASNLTGGGSGANVDWGGESCFHCHQSNYQPTQKDKFCKKQAQ